MNHLFVKRSIIKLCARPRTSEYLIDKLDGLDPIKLYETLEELKKEHIIEKRNDFRSLVKKDTQENFELFQSNPQLYLQKYMGYFDFLKIPHPLDYEWRNSTESLHYLINVIEDLNDVDDKILLLGMPTLFALCCIKDIPHNITLIERNKPIIHGLSKFLDQGDQFHLIEENIFTIDPQKLCTFNCVFMDPPWYSSFFRQFLWLAAKSVDIGGIVCISLPPINTKNNIIKERVEWISYCHEQGLCIEEIRKQKLHYAMPFFEFNALRIAGIDSISPIWRKGDLAIFKKIINNSTSRPPVETFHEEWIEKEFDNVRIRFKIDNDLDLKTPINIKHIISGDILPSVSRTHSKRSKANVVTSGNRIFNVGNTKKMIRIIENTNDKLWLPEEKQEVKEFLDYIIKLEKQEYINYLNWIYREMEK